MTKASVAASRVVFDVFFTFERNNRAQGPSIANRGSPECRSVDWAAIVQRFWLLDPVYGLGVRRKGVEVQRLAVTAAISVTDIVRLSDFIPFAPEKSILF